MPNTVKTVPLSGPNRPAGTSLLWLCLYALVLLVLAWRITPMSSPDEPHHLARAYTVAQGQWLLQSPPGRMSGGEVDPALIGFTHTLFTHVTGVQTPHTVPGPVPVFGWSGQRVFHEIPGAGYYFPALYAPAALGLALGEGLGLDLASSYALARGLSLAVVLALLAMALRLQPGLSLAWLPLCLPMSLFQAASPTLDGLSLALTLLVLALYRSLLQAPGLSILRLGLLGLLVFAVATVRLQMLPLLLLPVHVLWREAQRVRRQGQKAGDGAASAVSGLGLAAVDGRGIALVLLSALASVSWYAWALMRTVDTRVARDDTNLSVVAAYLASPGVFLQQFFNTVADPAFGAFVFRSMVGVLGWLNWPLPGPAYALLVLVALAWGALCLALAWPLRLRGFNPVLLLAALGSVALVFVSMAVNWTPLGSPTIQGIQGRYFLGTLMLLLMVWSPLGQDGAAGEQVSADSGQSAHRLGWGQGAASPGAAGRLLRLGPAARGWVRVLFLGLSVVFTLAALPR